MPKLAVTIPTERHHRAYRTTPPSCGIGTTPPSHADASSGEHSAIARPRTPDSCGIGTTPPRHTAASSGAQSSVARPCTPFYVASNRAFGSPLRNTTPAYNPRRTGVDRAQHTGNGSGSRTSFIPSPTRRPGLLSRANARTPNSGGARWCALCYNWALFSNVFDACYIRVYVGATIHHSPYFERVGRGGAR